MTFKRPANFRAIEILRILKANGPVSFKTLLKLVDPPMKEKKLRMALYRLQDKEHIIKRDERIYVGRGYFYQISQDRSDIEKTAKLISCPVNVLQQPHFSYRDLIHNDDCALWMNHIFNEFPDAQIIRDFEFNKSNLARQIMSINEDEIDLQPDLLVILRGHDMSSRLIAIAVEIEKSRKSDKRLIRKLYKYANRSHIDGVIYVCENKRIKEILQHVFVTDVLRRARRIEHYPQNFFLFSENVDNHKSDRLQLWNSEQKLISFKEWINYLQSNSFNSRRDKNMALMGE